MTNKTFKSLLAASAASLAIVGAANAGGFARGKADTQIIYEEGNFNMRSSVTIVAPTRKYKSAPGNPSLVGESYTETYVVPSFALKANITDDLRCAATMVNNLGGHKKQSAGAGPGGTGTFESELIAYEYGATCGYKFDLSKGRFWLLGGAFFETVDINKVANIGLGTSLPAVLNLDGSDVGFRVGAAYEIPEIALRGELMYRSGTSYGAKGSFDGFLPTGAPPPAPPIIPFSAPSTGEGEMPQSVELNLQSGVAPGWLAFGSVKWTDWSVTKDLVSNSPSLVGTPLVRAVDGYAWRDGWTVTGGVGHAFNETVSGLAAITWDRGVGTGVDLSSDTWTFSVGGSIKDKWGGELRGGVAYSHLAAASDTVNYPGDPADGTVVGSGHAIAGSIGYAIKW